MDKDIDKVINLASGAASCAQSVKDPLNFFNNLTSTVSHCIEVCEIEKTKQQKIQAETEVIIKKFETQKAIFEEYLDKAFDERSEQFKEYFKRVDEAMKSNNIQQMALLLDNMNKLAQSAPFAILSSIEETQKALSDKNYEWDFG